MMMMVTRDDAKNFLTFFDQDIISYFQWVAKFGRKSRLKIMSGADPEKPPCSTTLRTSLVTSWRTVVVVKWSACSTSTPMIRVWIPLKSTFFCQIFAEKIENKQKRSRDRPILVKSWSSLALDTDNFPIQEKARMSLSLFYQTTQPFVEFGYNLWQANNSFN